MAWRRDTWDRSRASTMVVGTCGERGGKKGGGMEGTGGGHRSSAGTGTWMETRRHARDYGASQTNEIGSNTRPPKNRRIQIPQFWNKKNGEIYDL